MATLSQVQAELAQLQNLITDYNNKAAAAASAASADATAQAALAAAKKAVDDLVTQIQADVGTLAV